MHVLVNLLKGYFRRLEYMVVYGWAEKGVYSRSLLFTSDKENMYKAFEELQLPQDKLFSNGKILCKSKSARIDYEMVTNSFLELYRVETHPSLLDRLEEFKQEQ